MMHICIHVYTHVYIYLYYIIQLHVDHAFTTLSRQGSMCGDASTLNKL